MTDLSLICGTNYVRESPNRVSSPDTMMAFKALPLSSVLTTISLLRPLETTQSKSRPKRKKHRDLRVTPHADYYL